MMFSVEKTARYELDKYLTPEIYANPSYFVVSLQIDYPPKDECKDYSYPRQIHVCYSY